MVWLSIIFRMGSNYFPGMISDSAAGVIMSNCWFLRKSSNITCIFFSFFLCGRWGGIDYWPFSPLWICACFVGKALITIVGCLETLCWVNKLAFIPSNNKQHHRNMARPLITKKIMGERERNILFISTTFGYGAQKNRLNETVSFIMFWSIKRKFIFNHTHFHSCRLSRCLWKDSLYLEW